MRDATEEAMAEVGSAIIAITLVMAAVFLPVAFISGPAGIFYRQFSLTMAVAIALSGIIALTLTPALCALFLRRHPPRAADARGFFVWFEARYASVERGYLAIIGRVALRRAVTVVALVGFAAGTGLLTRVLPTGFIPGEDQGVFYVSVTTPPGATLERTKATVDAIREAADGIKGIASVSTLAGTNILSDGTGATYGTCLVNLTPWAQRTATVEESG